jgi:hypothetical protein
MATIEYDQKGQELGALVEGVVDAPVRDVVPAAHMHARITVVTADERYADCALLSM